MAEKLTVAQIIVNLFKDAFGDQFKLYRVGDPIKPGQSELPAIFVTDQNVDFEQDATGYDKLTHHLLVQLVFNKKDEMGAPVDGNTLDTIIDNYMFGRDASTNAYLANSIMGVLRSNLTLGGVTVETLGSVRKGVVPRPEEMLTVEGHVEITASELQPVNNRS